MTATEKPHVVAIVGSPRRGGNTSLLTDVVLAELKERGATCSKLSLGELSVAPCRGHEDCAQREHCTIHDDAEGVLDQAYAADALLLATPVYYEDVTAQMKAFIDRNFFKYNHEAKLRPKVIGLLVVTAETGLEETLATLRRYIALSSDGTIPIVTLTGYADSLGAVAGDAELLANARTLGADMAAVLFGAGQA
jgi:multimeric flavodoxin WrbA